MNMDKYHGISAYESGCYGVGENTEIVINPVHLDP
jgi:hypothetical protein